MTSRDIVYLCDHFATFTTSKASVPTGGARMSLLPTTETNRRFFAECQRDMHIFHHAVSCRGLSHGIC